MIEVRAESPEKGPDPDRPGYRPGVISSRLSGIAGRVAAGLLAVLVTSVLYLILLVATSFAGGLRGTSELCPEKPLDPRAYYTYSAFPLQNQCNFADGTSKSLIPYWTYNGILFGSIAVTVVVALAVATVGRRRPGEVSSRPFLSSPGLLFAAGAATAVAAVPGVVFLLLFGLLAPALLFAGLMLAVTVFLLTRSAWALTEPQRRPGIPGAEPKSYRTAWERTEP